MSDTHENDVESAQCSSDRLRALIDDLVGLVQTRPNLAGRPFAEGMENLANALEFASYIELLGTYLVLVRQVRRDVESMRIRRESVRRNYLSALSDIEHVFTAKNFMRQTGVVIQDHFNSTNLGYLDAISNLLEDQEIVESSLDEMRAALSDAKGAAKVALEGEVISDRARRLIDLHLAQLNHIIESYENLGEQEFWASYRILFSSFIEIHENILDPERKAQSKRALRAMLNRLLIGSSLAANAITIASPGLAILGGP